MGGHVAEKLVIGKGKITSGCSSDLRGATQYATQAVRTSGMFGDMASLSSTAFDENSDKYNALVDSAVKKILDESFERVKNLLEKKDKELRRLSIALYEQDYLDAKQMDLVIRGKGLGKKEEEKVRTWDEEANGRPIIQFRTQ